jgi:hypothetical protein
MGKTVKGVIPLEEIRDPNADWNTHNASWALEVMPCKRQNRIPPTKGYVGHKSHNPWSGELHFIIYMTLLQGPHSLETPVMLPRTLVGSSVLSDAAYMSDGELSESRR